MADLRSELSDLRNGFILALIVSATKYVQTNIDVLRMLVNNRGFSGIYVTVNRPYESILRSLRANEIDTEKLFFIDVISKYASEKSDRTENCLFINSPERLTELCIALAQIIQTMPENDKFVFLDNVSALVIHNGAETIARFIHILCTKIRNWETVGVVVSLEKETDEKLFSQLNQFSDKTVVVDGGK